VISDSQASIVFYTNEFEEKMQEVRGDERVVKMSGAIKFVKVGEGGFDVVSGRKECIAKDEIELHECDNSAGAMIIYTR
jgi:hypothetical protein